MIKTKTRLEVLIGVLNINKESVTTRSSELSAMPVNEDSDEFIVKTKTDEVYYNVLKSDELDSRVQDLINDCYTEEEILENYGVDENGEPDLSTADINTYLDLVAESEGYMIYTPQC